MKINRDRAIRKWLGVLLVLTMLLSLLPTFILTTPVAAAGTTSVTITRYDIDGTTVLNQTTVDWEWMMNNLPVQGDGVTHYYCHGPTFTNDAESVETLPPGWPSDLPYYDNDFDCLWDPQERVNIDSRDYGAAMGTDVKDLCDLVGGASPGDTIKIKAIDSFLKWFDYENVYLPTPEQGKMVITWYTKDAVETSSGFVPDGYTTGMRLLFFPETLNPEGKHVFGLWDMHETMAPSRWHYYYDGTFWPSSSGLSVKWVSNLEIYTSKSVGTSLNVDSLDFGTVGPGESSAVKTVTISNNGSADVNITLEVQGADATARSFYEQSLYVDDSLYDNDTVISSIPVGSSDDVDTQLKVPATWSAAGSPQNATFVFWATASS